MVGREGEAVFMKDTLCARSSAGSDQSVSNWELVGMIIWGMMERWFWVVMMVQCGLFFFLLKEQRAE